MVVEHISTPALNEQESRVDESKEEKKNEEKEELLRSPIAKGIISAIQANPKIKQSQLADNLGVSESTIFRLIKRMKALGIVERGNGKRNGVWEVNV